MKLKLGVWFWLAVVGLVAADWYGDDELVALLLAGASAGLCIPQ
jgi:hypothetical protein